jgi:hypothetical protein
MQIATITISKLAVLAGGDITTGEAKFPECDILPRVLKIGHSGKNSHGKAKKEAYIYRICYSQGKIKKEKGGFPECLGRGHSGKSFLNKN